MDQSDTGSAGIFSRSTNHPQGKELQSEYFVAREHAAEAMRAVAAIASELQPVLHIAEVSAVGKFRGENRILQR
eukprot:2413654-Pyramimonas_sp.AAC.2